MFVIISRVIGVYSVFPVRANNALLRSLRPLTSPYLPHPPVNAHYLHIYGTPAVTSVEDVCQILEFCLCVIISDFYHSICQLSSVCACKWWSADDDDVVSSALGTAHITSENCRPRVPICLAVVCGNSLRHSTRTTRRKNGKCCVWVA